MLFILVVSRNVSCRRLYVDNLVRRGYVAVGVASAIEAENLLNTVTPDLVLVCCMPIGYEQDIEQFRTTYKLTGNLVLMSQDKPDPAWTARWNVTLCSADPRDLRRLVEILQPWLPVRSGATKAIGGEMRRQDHAEH
jgi:DNA-binding NtrC family response regulator